MQISVIICTHNRYESLKATLDSLFTQECDSSFDYEVLIVDNNSKDQTRRIVESYIKKFGNRMRYIFEPNQGLSIARNRGVEEAKGDIIAFTDDDVIVDKQWLVSIINCFKLYKCNAVGGASYRFIMKRFLGGSKKISNFVEHYWWLMIMVKIQLNIKTVIFIRLSGQTWRFVKNVLKKSAYFIQNWVLVPEKEVKIRNIS